MRTLRWLAFFLTAGISLAEERATIIGKVTEADGKAVEHATVLVYEAGAKKGYSVYCPTCYVDCGKHAFTDSEGSYAIQGLSPDLWFTLLVVKEGYQAEYVKKVNPAGGPAAAAVLKARPAIPDAAQIVRGHVVDPHGRPVRDAVVEQQGVTYRDANGQTGTRFGGVGDWIDQMAVTNEQGDFELAYSKPAERMILEVKGRGLAPKLFSLPTGADRKVMTVTDGASVQGRVVYNGKPVANAELGLTTHRRVAGTTYGEQRVGTKDDGTFALTGVPAGRIWYLYPKMESLAERGIGSDVVILETKDDGQQVDVGDVALAKAYTLRGRVVLSDGKAIPSDMHVTLSSDRAWDTQIAEIGTDGRFEFRGLPRGVYEIAPAVRGYRLTEATGAEVLVNGDVGDFVVRMEPGVGRP